MQQAIALAAAKARFPSTQEFHDWLIRNDLSYFENERAALINMGMNAQLTRAVLETTTSTSVIWIWRKEIAPKLEENQVGQMTNTEILH